MIDRKSKRKGAESNEGQARMATALTKPATSDLIAERLRMFYDDVSRQPVPDRFLELLKKLEGSDPKDGGH
jgi:hypothetical protein